MMNEEEKNLSDKTSAMPSEADDNQQRGEDKEEFKELQEFSGELIKLGQEIGERFKEKEQIEQEIAEKEKESRILQVETFKLKDKLMRINLELSKLEKRRKQLEGN